MYEEVSALEPESLGKILQQSKYFIFRHITFRLNIIQREDVFYDTKTVF